MFHSSFHKGTPVIVKMKDNTFFIDKFKDHKGGRVILEGRTVLVKDVKFMGVYKGETNGR